MKHILLIGNENLLMPLCAEAHKADSSVRWVGSAKLAREAIDTEGFDVVIWATHGPDAIDIGFAEEVRTALPDAGMIVLSQDSHPVFDKSLHLIGPDPHSVDFNAVALLLREFLPHKA